MERSLEELVWQRAHSCCEYCRMAQEFDRAPFEIDHIIARSHGGLTQSNNLALACFLCNSFKGTNLSGIDFKTRKIVRLFNPRRHKWDRHFHWEGAILRGKTPIGRATITVLRINLEHRVLHRQALMDEGVFPG
jgi:hypothetical protein